MARAKRAAKKMGRYIRGTVNESIALSTQAAKIVISLAFDENCKERTLISSLIARYVLSNWTPVSGAGPIMVGVAHNDYSAAEIEEYIEATGSWDEGDLTAQEKSRRKIRRIGIFDAAALAVGEAVLNDGKAIKTKLNWILNAGQGLQLWSYNLGTAAVSGTTNPVIQAEGHANLWPR